MARKPRLDWPDIPQHVIQRGNNRSTCFFSDRDRFTYLKFLREGAGATPCDVHAYVLMTNHVHLLVTGRRAGAVSDLMQSVGRRYARYVNGTYGRSGSLFEGRFRNSLVQSERYLLSCYRYIELNPVRAGIVEDPVDYRWSSHRHHALGEPNGLITLHPEFADLGDTLQRRCAIYRDLVEEALPETDLAEIRRHVNKGAALGDAEFHRRLEPLVRRATGVPTRGRPRKVAAE